MRLNLSLNLCLNFILMSNANRYYLLPAAAYVRGMTAGQGPLYDLPLASLSVEQCDALFEIGKAHELKLHRFKRTMDLPRVQKVLGLLRGLQPQNLLDIGTGRGVFLWPLLDTFPDLSVQCVDILPHRVEGLEAVVNGGLARLSADLQDVTALPFGDKQFDVVTFLETLEHIPATERAIQEVCRVAQRGVIISVPSKPDENPEHIHLFDQGMIRGLFAQAGVMKVKFHFVLNHLVALGFIG